MNKIFIITIFLMGILFTGHAQLVKCVNPSRIAFTAKIASIKKMDQGAYIYVKTMITNNSSDTLQYLSMSCSWRRYYRINIQALNIPTSRCDADTAMLITVAPHNKQEMIVGLISLINIKKLYNEKFKIGLKFVQACDTNKASKELRRSKNTIWSNSVIIKY